MSCPFLMSLWYDLAGKNYLEVSAKPSLEELRKTEWSSEFEELLSEFIGQAPNHEFITYMRNRLIMGAFRYGLMREQDYSKYDIPGYIKGKIKLFEEAKNLECLIDAANLCLIGYIHYLRMGFPIFSRELFFKYGKCISLGSMITILYSAKNPLIFISICHRLIQLYETAKLYGYKLIAEDDKNHSKEIY